VDQTLTHGIQAAKMSAAPRVPRDPVDHHARRGVPEGTHRDPGRRVECGV